MTGKQMCEAISKWQKAEFDRNISPEQVWEISPTGGVWPVFELYQLAEAAGYSAEVKQ